MRCRHRGVSRTAINPSPRARGEGKGIGPYARPNATSTYLTPK